MSNREKLIEILSRKVHPRDGIDPAIVVADYLLDNDIVPVVRCKDCRFWGDASGIYQRSGGIRFARCRVHNYCIAGENIGWCPTENDYCSCGERRH